MRTELVLTLIEAWQVISEHNKQPTVGNYYLILWWKHRMWSKGTRGEGSRVMELAPALQIYNNPYWSTCCYHAKMHYLIIHKLICGHVTFNLLCVLKNSITDIQIIPWLSYKTGMWLPTVSICYYALFQCNITIVMWKDNKTTKPSNKCQTFVLNMFIKLILSYHLQQ